VDQWQARLGDPRDHHIEAHIALVAPIGRTIRHDEQFRAGFGECLDDVLVVAPVGPGVFADRYAETHATKAHRARYWAGSKHPLLIEHAVVWQVHLEANRFDPAAIEQRISIVDLAVLDPWRSDQYRRTTIGSILCKRLDGRTASGLKGRLEH